MKIYIITIHCIHNFGSVFQSYGLVKYLRNNGYDAELIDYRPEYYTKGRNPLRKFVSIALNPVSYHRQYRRYQQFINEEIPKTGIVFKSMKELQGFRWEDDAIFIAGGDQIWNNFHPCGKDDAYKLTFVDKGKKIAYGTSMGRNSFSENELKDLATKVETYYSIGLREQSTVAMLQPYTQVPVYHAADPVLLLDREDYAPFIGKERLIKEPYLLMYLAAESDLLKTTVEKIARERGLKVVHVCGFSKKCPCDYFLKSTGPKDLLNLIYYSDFVVSASFHATLFSILFHKQFCTLLPEAGTNTRIEDVLSFYGISDRIIHSESELPRLADDVDFQPVDSLRQQLVEESKHQLINALKEA